MSVRTRDTRHLLRTYRETFLFSVLVVISIANYSKYFVVMATHTDAEMMAKLSSLKDKLSRAIKSYSDARFASSREELRALSREMSSTAEEVHHRCIYGALPPVKGQAGSKKKKAAGATVGGS